MPMPGETPRPSTMILPAPSPVPARRRLLAPLPVVLGLRLDADPDLRLGFAVIRSLFVELAIDQIGNSLQGRRCGRTADPQLDFAADTGCQHHQTHDRLTADLHLAFDDTNIRIKGAGQLHELGGCPGMQATLILDQKLRVRPIVRHSPSPAPPVGYFSLAARSCEATLIYLRPASCAVITASASFCVLRTDASLTSSGRLTPAMTSTLARSSIEIARFDGVPPNMSVASTTPSPSSTSVTRWKIS